MVLYCVLLPVIWLVWHILWRMKVVGRENLAAYRDKGFVIASNHISDIDPVFIVMARFSFHRMKILAKAELFRIWPIGFVLKCFGAVPIARGKGDTGTIDRVMESCRNGTGLLIFPEGTRTKTGQMGPLKSGAFVIAGQAGVDMIPCRIVYGTKSGKMRLFCRVRICFGTPIAAADLAIEDPKHSIRAIRELKHRLQASLDELYEQNKFD